MSNFLAIVKKYIDPIRIKSFTIFEMMVTILLSLLLFGLLYGSYQIIANQAERSKSDLSQLLQVKYLLDRSFQQSESITRGDNSLNFYSPSGSKSLETTDSSMVLFFNGMRDTVYKGPYSYHVLQDTSLDLVNAIQITFYTKSTPAELEIRKDYLPSIRIRRKEVSLEY